jgi:TolB protein
MNKYILSLALVALGFGPFARASFVVEVTRGQTEAIPLAVVPFASAELSAASFDVAQLVSDDLARSGRFRTMERADMIDQPHNGAAIQFDDWRRLNNDYMVVGSMQSDGPDHYSITYELYNVLTKQRLLGFQISANRPGLRSAGHQIADAVFEKILGIRGAFSTCIAYT